MKIFNLLLFIFTYFAASVVSSRDTKEWTDLFEGFIGMLQDANVGYTDANMVEMAELRAIWSEFEFKYLEEFKIQLPNVAKEHSSSSSQGIVVDLMKFKEYFDYAKPFDGQMDMMRFHEPISREEIFKELDKLANDKIRDAANKKFRVIENRLNEEIKAMKNILRQYVEGQNVEVKENLKKLEKEKDELLKVDKAFESIMKEIKEFVFNSKSLLIAGQIHGKLENLWTALENDAKKIYEQIHSEVFNSNDIFKISFEKIEESKKDELDAFFHSYDPEQLMRGLPLDKQKYVDDLILTEEKFYKDGIMGQDVAIGTQPYEVFVFRKFDTTKMEEYINNDIKVRQVYQKYKKLNELTEKLYSEIAEKVISEAPTPSFSLKNLIASKKLGEKEQKSLQKYEKLQLSNFFVKLIQEMLGSIIYSIEKVGPEYANLMKKEALTKFERHYRKGRNFIKSLNPNDSRYMDAKELMQMDPICKQFSALMRLIHVWIMRNELVEGYLKRLGLAVVRSKNEPGKIKIETELAESSNRGKNKQIEEDPILSQLQLDRIAEVLTVYENFAYFYNLNGLIDWVKKVSEEEGNDQIMRTIRMELNLDIPSAAAFPSYADDGIGAMVYELREANDYFCRNNYTCIMNRGKIRKRPVRNNVKLSPPWRL